MKSKIWGRALSGWFHNTYRALVRHPRHRWWVIAGTLLYLLGPMDLSPDMIPIVGWIDDGLIATLLVTELSQIVVAGLKTRRSSSDSSTSADLAQSPLDTAVIDVEAVSVQ